VWYLYAQYASIQNELDICRAVAAWARDWGDASCICSHRHNFDICRANRAMFTIDQDPIEPGIGEHLDELRRRKHQGDAQGDFAAIDLIFHHILHVAYLRLN
jgi:hypothetical protein